MVIADIPEGLKRFEVPGRVTLLEGNGDMCKIEANTDWSVAEVYLHGAQVTDFRKKGEAPLLYLSQCSRFEENHPIRGGIPLVFPWFGPREGMPAHGFARLAQWNLHEVSTLPEGGVSLRFDLPETALRATFRPFMANYVVTVTDCLTVELLITNVSAEQPFSFESCLHSYFAVGDAGEITILGLQGAGYLDATQSMAPKTDTGEALRIQSEVDRLYHDTDATVEIVDPKLRRRIRIEKTGAASTVVWNPWMQKSQQMPDFGNDEYREMVCVESGNVGPNRISLPPGQTAALKVVFSTAPL
jgi:D-hexose-6-phosphate mutarotase